MIILPIVKNLVERRAQEEDHYKQEICKCILYAITSPPNAWVSDLARSSSHMALKALSNSCSSCLRRFPIVWDKTCSFFCTGEERAAIKASYSFWLNPTHCSARNTTFRSPLRYILRSLDRSLLVRILAVLGPEKEVWTSASLIWSRDCTKGHDLPIICNESELTTAGRLRKSEVDKSPL